MAGGKALADLVEQIAAAAPEAEVGAAARAARSLKVAVPKVAAAAQVVPKVVAAADPTGLNMGVDPDLLAQVAAKTQPSLAVVTKAQAARDAKAAALKAAVAAEKKRVGYRSPVTSDLAVKPGSAPPDLAVDPTALAGADSPLLVSTRNPTAPNFSRFGNPDEQMLWQNSEALQQNPEAFAKNMKQLQQEPFMAGVSSLRDPYKVHDYALDQGSKNLEFIVNDLMDPEKVGPSRGWYPTAKGFAERAAARNNMPDLAGYGTAAVFSPQTPWDINVGRMDRMMDMWGDRFQTDPEAAARWVEAQRDRVRNPKNWGAIAKRGPEYAQRIASMDPEELTDKFDRFARVALADATRNDPSVPRVLLNGEYGDPYGNITWGSGDVVNKAWNILQNPDMPTVRGQLLGGGKVPTFYNNIAAPDSRLPLSTIDTHSAGAFSLYPGGGDDPIVYRSMGLGPSSSVPKGPRYQGAASPDTTGAKGLYGVVSDAHDLARQRLGFDYPREVQSATWEGVRDLWGQDEKTPALKAAIADVWRQNADNPDEARWGIADLLGRPSKRVYAVDAPAP